ncbi:dipeptidyl aminopeptidase/acylaminoacyl peptidase [Planomicrobium soli]|uniref:Acyl-peptide hydrolase n=1 Tax=Planomicrobium soli TaxID=1176648 RepID=A0A2P8H6D7_9BACL|nr:S9 family peptidase [Planomicrobium soli]PSL41797.1 dipeptidyl aminopeptidase/acylaminoacyl peptidase [Planomicrobium soli]
MIEFPKPKVEQFFRTYSITDFALSGDEERLIFSSNLNGKVNLWAMDLPNLFPYLFAHRDESVSFIKFDPKNRYVLAGFDKDGDENHQIYALPAEGGLPEPLVTGNPEEKYYYAHLSEDGNRLYYMTSEGNPSFLNAYVKNLEDQSDTLLHEGSESTTYLESVSENEQAFVYTQSLANTYVRAFVKHGDETHYLTPDPEKVHVAFESAFVNDSSIYFLTDYDSDFVYLAHFDLEDKLFSEVLKIENESLQNLKWNKEQNMLYFSTEKGVTDLLYRFDPDSTKLEQVSTPVDIIDKIQITKSGNLYLLGTSATKPHNIFQWMGDSEWKPLTDNRVLGLSEEDLVDPEEVSFQSYDGLEIEALLFKPKPENDNGHAIFWPHGGPQHAERKQFRSMFQCFLNRGYTIFAPNFRGSTGYGSSFVKLVEQDWGEGPRLDCLAAINWLFDNKLADPEKLFLIGGSYGGYMALLLHGRHPEYFKAVVDIFGVSNLFTFVESVPPHWKPIMERWLGDPVRDKDRFTKDSPVTYLDGMEKPMLVIQGAKDPRVVKEESDQIVAKLKEKGREVEYLVLDDEGHGFSKKENEIKVYSAMLDFLEKHQV